MFFSRLCVKKSVINVLMCMSIKGLFFDIGPFIIQYEFIRQKMIHLKIYLLLDTLKKEEII